MRSGKFVLLAALALAFPVAAQENRTEVKPQKQVEKLIKVEVAGISG